MEEALYAWSGPFESGGRNLGEIRDWLVCDQCDIEEIFRNIDTPPFVILVGIYPLALVLPPLMNPIMESLALPEPVKALIFSVFMVGLMTWAIMPLLNRALSRWLHPSG